MPGVQNYPAPGTATAVTITTTAETVAVTSSPLNIDNLETIVSLDWFIDLSLSAASTFVTVKIERGTVAGGTTANVGGTVGPFNVTASQRIQLSGCAIDRPGQSAGLQYVVTVTVTAASGNSTVNTAVLETTVAAAT